MPAPPPEMTSYLPETCRELAFEGVVYIVCEVGTDSYDLVLRRADETGKPFGASRNWPPPSRSSSP